MMTGCSLVETCKFHGGILLTDIESERNSSWKNQSADKINKDNELHTEAEGTAKISDEDKFHEVVHRTVDPSTSLRQ